MAPTITHTTIQATFLAILSNVLAQCIEAYRSSKPLHIDVRPVIDFVVFTVISTPPNVVWQEFLENQFPSYTGTPGNKTTSREKLNIRNTMAKFCLDQTVGMGVNTILFVGGMAALKGMNNKDILYSIRNDTWPLILAGYKVWPLVSVLSFTLIPVHQRVVFASVVGVGWGIFLSLFANK